MELSKEQMHQLSDAPFYFEIEDKSAERLKDERRIIHFISTPELDRGRDVMNPKGMDSSKFENTRTVFFNHNYDNPIGKNVKLVATNDGVKATTYFSDKTQLAKDIYNLHLESVLNTWSIGFMPMLDKDGKIEEGSVIYDEKGIRTFRRWQLLEYSSTGIPMNPGAIDIAKNICKSFELKKEIQFNSEILNIKNVVSEMQKEITGYKELLQNLNENKNETFINEIKNEISLINERLETVGKANISGLSEKDEIIKAIKSGIVGALNGFTGRKYSKI